uniref:Zgc:162200 n=1 Tax=Astyanax mexicanus TaxID=7994 RepID=A0A8B9HCK0_ASTMX
MLEEEDLEVAGGGGGGGGGMSLQAEVERLTAELQEANEEKLQAARYGLAVLEESATLKTKHVHLEEEHEALKLELQQLREALADSVSSQKRAVADGETREECLLQETASKEAAMATRMEELQAELKQARLAQANTMAEIERMAVVSTQMKKVQSMEKVMEMYCLLVNSALSVQLVRELVEFEALKVDLTQKDEEQDLLRAQLEEAGRLKEIAERQLDEALEALKEEREQKNSLKRELAAHTLNPFDSVVHLDLQLDDSLDGGKDKEGGEDGEGDQDSGYNNSKGGEKQRCSTPRNSDIFLRPQAPGLVADLLSELHLSDSQKLKQQVLQLEKEKGMLTDTVQDLQEQLVQSKEILDEHKVKVEQLSQRLEAMEGCSNLSNGVEAKNEDDFYELDAKSAEVLECRMRAANAELMQLRDELREAGNHCKTLDERYKQEKERWRAEAQELADKIRQCIAASRQDQERIGQLEREIGATRRVATDSEGHLSATQEELLAFSEELANLYHHVCVCNNLTPRRVTLDYYREGARSGRHHHSNTNHHHGAFRKQRRSAEAFGKGVHSVDVDLERGSGDTSPTCGSCPGSPTMEFRDPTNVRNLVALIRCQIKHLQVAVDLCRQRGTLPSPSVVSFSESDRDADALLEEVLKLKSLLSTKREQIATLRTVLKANKQTAELALSNLKTKYETEKTMVSETMVKLRNELKALKEDAATFSSLRVMFASRCDQYVTQLDEMQRQLAAAEDEKKTLNSLLRMAIQQKLALTQRLEDLEAPLHSHSNGGSPRRSRTKQLSTKSGRAPRSPMRNSPRASPVMMASTGPQTMSGHLRALSRSLHGSPVRHASSSSSLSSSFSSEPLALPSTSTQSLVSVGLARDATFVRSRGSTSSRSLDDTLGGLGPFAILSQQPRVADVQSKNINVCAPRRNNTFIKVRRASLPASSTTPSSSRSSDNLASKGSVPVAVRSERTSRVKMQENDLRSHSKHSAEHMVLKKQSNISKSRSMEANSVNRSQGTVVPSSKSPPAQRRLSVASSSGQTSSFSQFSRDQKSSVTSSMRSSSRVANHSASSSNSMGEHSNPRRDNERQQDVRKKRQAGTDAVRRSAHAKRSSEPNRSMSREHKHIK